MIREMTRADLEKLPALHASANSSEADHEQAKLAFEQLFPRLFFDSPWSSGDTGGLVSEASAGSLDGALGVFRRSFLLEGERVHAAVSSEFFVDPDSRSSMLGIQMLKEFLNGPQDVAIADVAKDNTRQIWLRLGGIVASLYSANWLRILRPAGFVNWALRQKTLTKVPAMVCSPFTGPMDRLMTRLASGRLDVEPSGLTGEPLTPELFAEHFERMTADSLLRPEYDLNAVRWLWCRLNFVYRHAGASRQVVLRDTRGNLAGWYIYQGSRGAIGRVAQLVATSSTRVAAFRHLLSDAQSQGLVALQGRIQPQDMQAVLENGGVLMPRSTHVLIHSRNERVLDAFRTGRAFLSQFEGEALLDIWHQPEAAIEALNKLTAS